MDDDCNYRPTEEELSLCFSETEWKNMTDYEKELHMDSVENYRIMLLKLGIKTEMPEFLKNPPRKVKINKTAKRAVKRNGKRRKKKGKSERLQSSSIEGTCSEAKRNVAYPNNAVYIVNRPSGGENDSQSSYLLILNPLPDGTFQIPTTDELNTALHFVEQKSAAEVNDSAGTVNKKHLSHVEDIVPDVKVEPTDVVNASDDEESDRNARLEAIKQEIEDELLVVCKNYNGDIDVDTIDDKDYLYNVDVECVLVDCLEVDPLSDEAASDVIPGSYYDCTPVKDVHEITVGSLNDIDVQTITPDDCLDVEDSLNDENQIIEVVAPTDVMTMENGDYIECDDGQNVENNEEEEEEEEDCRSYICVYCTMKFDQKNTLIKHLRRHTRPYRCDQCDAHFGQSSTLKTHMRCVHMAKRNYACDFCGANFAMKHHLDGHLETHIDDRPHLCDYCGAVFRQKCNLYQHVKIKHHNTIEGQRQSSCYLCNLCGTGFAFRHYLKRHMAVHSNELPHVCKHCGDRFSRRAYLMKHLNRYKLERAHKCEHCAIMTFFKCHSNKHIIESPQTPEKLLSSCARVHRSGKKTAGG